MRADPVGRLGLQPAAAVEAVKSAVAAASPRLARALSRAARRPERWVERRLPLDLGVSVAARRAVAEVLSGRVSVPVVDRAQLVVSEFVSHGVLHGAGSSGEVIVRLGLGGAACRIEVETDAPAPPAISHPHVDALSERWGFERTVHGATRIWAELSELEASGGEPEHAGARAAVRPMAAGVADLHVLPNERAGTWNVYDARIARAMSEHSTETEAEAAARVCARVRGGRRIVIHDRYHRTRETMFENKE